MNLTPKEARLILNDGGLKSLKDSLKDCEHDPAVAESQDWHKALYGAYCKLEKSLRKRARKKYTKKV